ncbi:MAG: DUF3108 domain-containing protein [Casimicrobiaceae bacterium]
MESLAQSSSLAVRWPTATRTYRVLAVALGISLAIHLAFTEWPIALPDDPDDIPLTATLTELPPPAPPLPVPQPARKAVPRASRVSANRTVSNAVSRSDAALVPEADAATTAAPPAAPTREAAAPAPAALTEAVDAPPPLPESAKSLPPRVDLAYKLYLGSHGFLIGDATYRFEHSGNRYRIYTVGKAKGLAALLIRGEGRLESRGLITADGLQPYEFTFERSDTGKREEAKFDWEAGIVTLSEQKTASIDTPMFDALSLMWQYYFTPPDESKVAFTLATTRRVTRYTVTHEGNETITWGKGTIDTERWHRRSDDGNNDSYAWLAPSLRYLPVKMRLANTRGSVEVVLDAIRVDPSQRRGTDTWAPDITGGTDNLTPPPPAPGVAPPPTEFAPGATFPTSTGS